MDEINKIRKLFFSEGKTKHAIAKRFSRSWETIDRIVSTPRDQLEHRGSRPNREAVVMTPDVIQAIEAYLDEEVEKRVKRKQRFTARKIYKDLKAKGIYKGSERRMQDFVKKLRNERNQTKKQSFLPLDFPLGSTLQVDHGEVDLIINNQRVTGYLFIASVPGYVLRYCQIFPTKAQEAWGEFHERAFKFFGGTFPKVVYDNDSVLIKKILGAEKKQTTFSLTLEEHYKFESHFCNVAAGNEKGAVENGVGYCRRNFLPGCPSFFSWDEVNQHLLESCNRDIQEEKHYKTKQPLKKIYGELKKELDGLPPKKSWYKRVNCLVNSYQLVSIDCHEYSVPEKFVGSKVEIFLEVFQVKIRKDEEVIATHERRFGDEDSLILDHYLEQLRRKPSALWDCKAVSQHKFDQRYFVLWEKLAEKFPKNKANKQLVKTLFLTRRYPEETVLKAIDKTLTVMAIDYVVVELGCYQIDQNQKAQKEQMLRKTLKSLNVCSWEFDISPYAKLCGEVKV